MKKLSKKDLVAFAFIFALMLGLYGLWAAIPKMAIYPATEQFKLSEVRWVLPLPIATSLKPSDLGTSLQQTLNAKTIYQWGFKLSMQPAQIFLYEKGSILDLGSTEYICGRLLCFIHHP